MECVCVGGGGDEGSVNKKGGDECVYECMGR